MFTLFKMARMLMNHPRMAWLRGEEGQTVIEYVLVVVLIALVLVFLFMNDQLTAAITTAGQNIALCISNPDACPYAPAEEG